MKFIQYVCQQFMTVLADTPWRRGLGLLCLWLVWGLASNCQAPPAQQEVPETSTQQEAVPKEASEQAALEPMAGPDAVQEEAPAERSIDGGNFEGAPGEAPDAGTMDATLPERALAERGGDEPLAREPMADHTPVELPRDIDPRDDPTRTTTAIDLSKRSYLVASFQALFGAGQATDTPLQRHRWRLFDGYLQGAVGAMPPNAESLALVKSVFADRTGQPESDWDGLSLPQQQDFLTRHRVSLWDQQTIEARTTFLSITKALVLVAILATNDVNGAIKQHPGGAPVTALDYVASLHDIHGQTTGAKGDASAPDLGEFRLGVRYTTEGHQWLLNKGFYAQLQDDGSIKQREQAKRHGTHSTHKGFDDWGASANTPNLQWQYRKADAIGEIDIDYDHHGIWTIFAGTQGNSNVLTIRTLLTSTKDHLEQFTTEWGSLGVTRQP